MDFFISIDLFQSFVDDAFDFVSVEYHGKGWDYTSVSVFSILIALLTIVQHFIIKVIVSDPDPVGSVSLGRIRIHFRKS